MFSESFTKRIHEVYHSRREAVSGVSGSHVSEIECRESFFRQLEENIERCTGAEQVLLHYLYGNMPLSDMFNYSFETFLDYARHGVFLWEKGLFAGEADEETFCQYVVYHRVNTEDISPCRSFFYEKAHEEIGEGSSMEQAVLDLNYWCAQEASYRASDDRTASPMTVYRSSCGRCGEESTFVVSVLRSMGIPARQVYAPRWSHCDDNHAWAEALCGDTWYFIGACEPEEVLNKGWFLHASSRAMLIHSRWYGKLKPAYTEELVHDGLVAGKMISRKGVVSELNETSRYANTKKVKIQVLDLEEKAVAGAQVRIEILNYAEFFTVAELLTDENGCAEIDLGMGSCRIHVNRQKEEGARIVCVEEDCEIQLILGERSEDVFEFFAPKDAAIHAGTVTEVQKNKQKEKLANRTEIRLKKSGTGNEEELEQFLASGSKSERKQLLETLSEKDYLDVRSGILEAHLNHAKQYRGLFEENIYTHYILAPRISLEILTDYRNEIDHLLTTEEKIQFKQNPSSIWSYIQREVKCMAEEEYDALLTLPGACLTYKIGSIWSQKVLFVAICRTLGIPAGLNEVDHEPEYWNGERFVKPGARGSAEERTPDAGTLRLSVDAADKFVYFQNWSVSRIMPGGNQLLDLSREKMSNVLEVILPTGTYEIVTANRLPNGNILGRVTVVEVVALDSKKITEITDLSNINLVLEDAELSQMLESVLVPDIELTDEAGNKKEMSDILKGRNHLVIWMIPGQEPSEHILNELWERADAFNKSGEKISFIVNSPEDLKQKTMMRTMEILNHVEIFFDCVEERVQELGRRFYVDPESVPLILVTDKHANSVYAASGYNVGTADMILKIFSAGVLN